MAASTGCSRCTPTTRRPRLLVRGRRLRPRPRCPPSHRNGVGEGGDLGPELGAAPVPVGRRASAAGAPSRTSIPLTPVPSPRPRRDRCLALRLRADGRRRVGVDRHRLRRLPRIRGVSVQGVLRGVLRLRLQGAEGRLVGDPRAGDQRAFRNWDYPSAGRSSPASGSQGTYEHVTAPTRSDPLVSRQRRARSPTMCWTASPGRSRSCRRSTSTTPRIGAVRADLRASRVLPDARGAAILDERAAKIVPSPAPASWSSSARDRPTRRGPARRDGGRRHAPSLHPARRLRDRRSRCRRAAGEPITTSL